MLHTGMTYEVLLEHSRGWLLLTHGNVVKAKLQEYKLQECLRRYSTEDLANIGKGKKSVIDFREQKNFNVRSLEALKIGYKRIGKKK